MFQQSLPPTCGDSADYASESLSGDSEATKATKKLDDYVKHIFKKKFTEKK